MKQDFNATLTRRQIKDIFRANKGSVARLAIKLDLKHPTISDWLRGKTTSERIAVAAQKMALELRESEKVSAA